MYNVPNFIVGEFCYVPTHNITDGKWWFRFLANSEFQNTFTAATIGHIAKISRWSGFEAGGFPIITIAKIKKKHYERNIMGSKYNEEKP